MALQPYRSAVYEELNLLLGNITDKKAASAELWDKLYRQMTEQYVGFPSLEKLAQEIEHDVTGLALLNEICPGSPNLTDGMLPLISYECFSCGIGTTNQDIRHDKLLTIFFSSVPASCLSSMPRANIDKPIPIDSPCTHRFAPTNVTMDTTYQKEFLEMRRFVRVSETVAGSLK